ncbi:deoxyribose-phosphate aldolase [Bowdeniella nasicola]|uniref:Deoxyribose-phosphate aldolase n=1 Tax=Bowdeniella nasicola TaxID=208480 RepID=A0A1Q5Q1V8_9ACTO|nr:deoxyribose-phosphate aldolase [Bowdeniella nasicola]OKL53821.1 deoxyribose-phosphate aldolase [Bowdeniella nasicola]
MKISDLPHVRMYEPERIAKAFDVRKPGTMPAPGENMMIIACDHPARGALAAGDDPMAMSNREDLLERCVAALARPGVTGFLGTADIIEDLTLLGALEGKLVFGSMNRAGLQGSSFEMDDQFNCYDAHGIVAAGLDGGKTLTRINMQDPATPDTLHATSQAINELAEHRKPIMVEPFISHWHDGRITNELTPDAVIRSIAIASGLGRTSAYTWLKLPYVDDMERVMASCPLPALILGGEVPADPEAALVGWASAMSLPHVFGLVIGRSLLYPRHGDVERAVDEAVELL